MNAVIITPAYSHAHHALHLQLQRSGLPWLPRYEHSDLPRVRSVLIEEALGFGAERVLFVDADTVPADGVLRALAEHPRVDEHTAVWGMYPLREGTRWSVNPLDPEAADRAIAEGRPFEIKSGGLGLACVHRKSLERIWERPWPTPVITEDTGVQWRPFCVPFTRYENGRDRYFADDGSLCFRLRDSETALHCDPTLRAGHVVSQMITRLRDETPGTASAHTRSPDSPNR